MDSDTGGNSRNNPEQEKNRVFNDSVNQESLSNPTEDTTDDLNDSPETSLNELSSHAFADHYTTQKISAYDATSIIQNAEQLSQSSSEPTPSTSEEAHQGYSSLAVESSNPNYVQLESADNSNYTQLEPTDTPHETIPPSSDSEPGTLKDTPINQENINSEWQQYHSAWQQYYQNYYNEYYSQAAQNYLEQEKLKTERIAKGEERKKRRIKHFFPLVMGAVVVLVLLFLQFNRLIFAPIMAYVSPDTNSVSTSIEAVDPSITQAVSPDPRLIIPKLNVDVPVAFDIDYNTVMSFMNHGVAQFKIPGASAMPGEVGNLVISGHSAGDIYSSNPYKFIFSGLERLNVGDLIYINYNSVRYTYRMTGSNVVEPSNVEALIYPTDKPILTLITCTPLGTSRYRLLITAEQISPNYEPSTASQPSEAPDFPDLEDVPTADLPSNEPSFFEKIWNWITGKNKKENES